MPRFARCGLTSVFGFTSADNRHSFAYRTFIPTLVYNSITLQTNMLAPRFIRTCTRAASVWTSALCQSTRALHSSALYGARQAEAPSVESKARATQSTISNPPHGSRLDVDGEAIWPIALLKSAKASGALTIGPKDAVSFLESYARLASTNVGGLQKLCQGSPYNPHINLHLLNQI